jgi:hypothetical protein
MLDTLTPVQIKGQGAPERSQQIDQIHSACRLSNV